MNSKMLVIKAKSEPMKGIVKPLPNQIYKHPNLVIQNREKKKLGSNDIRLQMLYVGICGSDLHLAKENSETGYIISSAPAFIPEEGRVIGHEGVGKVLDVGENVKNIHKDMIVTLESILVCNQCVQCKQGKFNQCKNAKLIGLEIDGIMGEVVDVNSSLAHDITPYVKEEKDLKAMDYICCSSYGRPRSTTYIYTHYKKLIEEAGLPYIRFHDLRHTYTTLLMKNDINQKAIAASLGHSKSIITFDVYTDKQALIEGGVEEIDAFIDEVHPYDSEDIQILKEKYGKKVLHRLA